MTNFAMKLIEFLDEDVIELLWRQATKEATTSGDEDIFEYAKNAFIDLVSDFVYEKIIGSIGNEDVRELLEAAFEDTDKEDLVNYIIVSKNYQISEV